jgi:predicted PurR-regulated permease PerM
MYGVTENTKADIFDQSTLVFHPNGSQVQIPSFIDPLTCDERRLVSRHIRKEITLAASSLLKHEQTTKARLHSVHIKCISLSILAACAAAYAMIYLQGVLVPFTLAIFFMFLLEPLLSGLLHLPIALGHSFDFFKPVAERLEQEKTQRKTQQRTVQRRAAQPDNVANGDGNFDASSDDAGSVPSSPENRTSGEAPLSFGDQNSTPDARCGGSGKIFMMKMSWKAWSLISVLLCLGSLLAFAVFLVVLVVRSLNDFPWRKYAESKKLRVVLEWFPDLGADPNDFELESVMPWLMQSFFLDAIGTTFKIISMACLTLLFLAFLLASDVELLENDDSYGIGQKVRVSVRRYIRIKTQIALVVACLIGLFLYVMEVDLAFLFAILTFLLSYIPHVGYTIAVLAPLPIVFLDPNKTLADLILVFIIPFVIHQFASNLLEPKLLAESLDLHPIVVLLALAFWTTVWGAVGAILSVPLTAVLRLVLLEVDHPYTRPIVALLRGGKETKPSSLQKTLQILRDDGASDAGSPRGAKKKKMFPGDSQNSSSDGRSPANISPFHVTSPTTSKEDTPQPVMQHQMHNEEAPSRGTSKSSQQPFCGTSPQTSSDATGTPALGEPRPAEAVSHTHASHSSSTIKLNDPISLRPRQPGGDDGFFDAEEVLNPPVAQI